MKTCPWDRARRGGPEAAREGQPGQEEVLRARALAEGDRAPSAPAGRRHGEQRPRGGGALTGSVSHSSALFSDGSAATGQASLLSEGLRESLSSYMSLTDGSLDDAKAHSRGRKGNPDCST